MELTKTIRNIDSLHNWDKNPRSISDKGFARLKKQIQTLGMYKPLLITEDGTVLGGNMRLRAYRDLGIKDVWVSIVDAPTEEKKLEYALSDNDRAGFYDDDLLANLTGEMPDFNWGDYSVDLKEPTNLQDLLDQFKEVVEDEVPEATDNPVSKLNEVYQLGGHRLMCGDSTKIGDVEKLMDGKKADMVFTDPPYGMDLDASYKNSAVNSNLKIKASKGYDQVIGDNKQFNYQDYLWINAKEEFWWGGDYYAKTLLDGGSWFVWDKRKGLEETKFSLSEFELCWSKVKHAREIARFQWFGAFGTQTQDIRTRVHPTQKPIQLCGWFIKKFSEDGWNILDLFGGSGSTLIACEQTNRVCYMMELDPKYCDVIRKRYAKFIGKEQEWQTLR